MTGNRGRRLRVVAYGSVVEAQVEADFAHARRRAFFGRVWARLRGERDHLLVFDEARKAHRSHNRLCLGRRAVEVSKIGGSVCRHEDFDRAFMPVKESLKSKWKRVNRAFHRWQELPPVRLYKIGSCYFVEDGHHRVSVARYQGVEWIDAEVIEFFPGLSASWDPDTTKQ
jgi:hypothetical protein